MRMPLQKLIIKRSVESSMILFSSVIFTYLHICCFVSFWHVENCILLEGFHHVLPWWDCDIFRSIGDIIVKSSMKILCEFLIIDEYFILFARLMAHLLVSYILIYAYVVVYAVYVRARGFPVDR